MSNGVVSERLFRKEHKYIIDQAVFENLKTELKHYLQPDPHMAFGGYSVRTVYFDTYQKKDLFDVLNGNNHKAKVRLRTYGSCGSQFFLELKQKVGEDICKRKLSVSRDEAENLLRGDYRFLLSRSDDFSKSLYCRMASDIYRPAVIIEYNRQAYVSPFNGIRITFDNDIKTGINTEDIFEPSIGHMPVMNKLSGVLEVKYSGFLFSPIKMLLERIEASNTANSKYVNAQLNLSF